MDRPKLSDYTITRVDTTQYRNQTFDKVDFSNQQVEHLRFFDCTLTNCSFDHADCRDLRMWGTTIRGCTFTGTNLRDSALGGVDGRKINRFESVRFDHTDMRGTAHHAAVFADCSFDHAKLTKVDFQGSRFTRCTFRGELREVLFYDHGFRGEGFEANRMENVDFRAAQLRWVEFRRLDLDSVIFPTDEDHIIIPDYPKFLDYALRQLQESKSHADKVLLVRLQSEKKWLGPRRTTGVFNRRDFLEYPEDSGVILRLNELRSNVA
jgi:fluoroquinolone resistance protein